MARVWIPLVSTRRSPGKTTIIGFLSARSIMALAPILIFVPLTLAGYDRVAITAYAVALHLPQIVVLIALGTWAMMGKGRINLRELWPGSEPADSEQAEGNGDKKAPIDTSP